MFASGESAVILPNDLHKFGFGGKFDNTKWANLQSLYYYHVS